MEERINKILKKHENELNHSLQQLLREIRSELEERDIEAAIEGDEQMISIDKFELSFDYDYGVIILNNLK